jgi:ABC-type phosphate transport system substrate-binding protein
VTLLGLSFNSMADELVVISAKKPPLTLTQGQLSDVFLGRITSFPDGSAAVPVDQPESSPLREEFYLKVTNKSAAQARAHWAKLYFTGRGVPPRHGESSEDVKRMVNTIPGAIGYIDSSSLDDSVRVVFVVP